MKRKVWLWAGLLSCVVIGGRIITQEAKSAAPSKPAPKASAAPASFQSVKAQVKPYKVSASLKEVTNLKSFKKAVPLTPQQEKMLAQNLLVCSPTSAQQLFYIYEHNDYKNLPSFVTTDLVLQLYHIFYDFTLRTVESESLFPVLKRLSEGMLNESIATWKAVSDPKLKQAALKNVAYFGVAARALKSKISIPPEAARLVQKELALMDKHQGFDVGGVFPYKIDYSQFAPRGHYTRSEKLKQFFRAMMWYGLAPFSLYYQSDKGRTRADEQIRQSLLFVRTLYRSKFDDEWMTIYEPTAFYVGAADDLTPAEWKRASEKVFGKDAPVTAFVDKAKFDAFVAEAEKLRPARVQPKFGRLQGVPAGTPKMIEPPLTRGNQLRFMGQRYIPDSEVLQSLSHPIDRVFPSGLDVMAVMGSPRAAVILDAYPKVYNEKNWKDYKPTREKLIQEFAAVKPATWTSNLYWSWLHSLRALLEPIPNGFPSFMLNDAWKDKSIHTALASWAELRHDTILYGKQSVVECGGGEDVPFVKGYVEPNVVFYDRLLRLTTQSRQGLAQRKLLSAKLKEKFEQFEDLLAFLKRMSEKQLRNEKLKREEYEDIRYIGGKIEYLTVSVMEGNVTSWELVSETDKDMAVIADVHTGGGAALEEGVGRAHEILVIVPIEGKLTLTRGAAFSYYEFKQPISNRLTDEAWQAALKAGKAPDPPVWTKTFLLPGKSRPMKSSEFAQYSSGC
jgi:hypothetical protein